MLQVQSNRFAYITSVWISAFILSACNAEDKGFSGGGGRAVKVPQPKPQDSNTGTGDVASDPPTTQTLPTSCTEAKLDSVKNLTTYVNQNSGAGSVALELTFLPCPSQVGTIQLPMLFDVDAETYSFDENDQRLSYEILINGVKTSGPGFLNHIPGRDLFGKVGDNYAHYKSDGAFSVSPSISKAKINISFRNTYVSGPIGSGGSESNFTVPMYVKVGQADPVRVNVTFTPGVQPQ